MDKGCVYVGCVDIRCVDMGMWMSVSMSRVDCGYGMWIWDMWIEGVWIWACVDMYGVDVDVCGYSGVDMEYVDEGVGIMWI